MDEKKQKIDFCARWKQQLTSTDINSHKTAFFEILEMLNKVTVEIKGKILHELIHSDMVSFIVGGISANDQVMRMANKIVFLLSGQQAFFKYHFVRVLRAYVKIFPFLVEKYKNSKTIEDVANIFSLVIKRGIVLKMEVPVEVLRSVFKLNTCYISMELLSSSIYLFSSCKNVSKSDEELNADLFKIFSLISMEKFKSRHEVFCFGNTFVAVLDLFQFNSKMENLLVDKYLQLFDFVFDKNKLFPVFDAFLNVTNRVYESSAFSYNSKCIFTDYALHKRCVDYLMGFIAYMGSDCPILSIKLRIFLADIMRFVLHQNSTEKYSSSSKKLQKFCKEICLSVDFDAISEEVLVHKLDSRKLTESILLFLIFFHYATVFYSPRNDMYEIRPILINLVTIMKIFASFKLKLKPVFLNMIMKIFGENYRMVSPGIAEFIRESQSELVQLVPLDNVPDINTGLFLKIVDKRVKISNDGQEKYLDKFHPEMTSLFEASLFDADLIKQIFAAGNTKEIPMINVSILLALNPFLTEEYDKCCSKLILYSKVDSFDAETRMICYITCLKNMKNIDSNLKNKVPSVMLKIMKKRDKYSAHVQIAIMDLAVNLLTSISMDHQQIK